MNDALKDANLALLIGLTKHLEHAERLRLLLDELLRLAQKTVEKNVAESAREGEVARDR